MSWRNSPKLFHNPWVVGTGSGLLVIVFSGLAAKVGIENIVWNFLLFLFKSIGSVLSAIWNHLTGDYSINRFLLYLLLVILLYVFRKWLSLKSRDTIRQTVSPVFTFREVELKGLVWKWEWILDDETNKYSIDGLSSHCPACDLQLNPSLWGFSGTTFKCETCNKTVTEINREYSKLINWVKREIIRRTKAPKEQKNGESK